MTKLRSFRKYMELFGYKLLAVAFVMFSAQTMAQDLIERSLGEMQLFPVAAELKDSDDKPISVIDTGIITNDAQEEARGPHDLVFTLSSSAAFGVIINGQTVQPGENYTLSVNLTDLEHRVVMPIYPATSGVEGNAGYSLSIPDLNVDICPEGFTERPSDCYKIEYATLTYICPSSHSYKDSTEDCRYVDTVQLTTSCPDSYTQSGDTCTKVTSQPYSYECDDPNMAVNNGMCESESTAEPTTCPEGYSLDSNGQCSTLTNSDMADSPCPENYTNTGSQCERDFKRSPTSNTFECDGNDELKNGKCYEVSSNPLDYTLGDNRYDRDALDAGVFWLKDKYTIRKTTDECPSDYPHEYYSPASGELCFSDEASDRDLLKYATGCVSGFTFNGGGYPRCLDNSTAYDPVKECSWSYSYNSSTDMCEKTVTKSHGDYCGYTKSDSSFCYEYNYTVQGVYCPAGMTYDDTKKSCVASESVPANKVCNDGFALTAGGSQCEKTETVQLDVSCPLNYTRSADGQYCFESYSQPAGQSCDSGWTKNGTTCNYFDSQPVASCPSGFVKISGNCHEVVVKSESCQSGYYNGGDGTCYNDQSQSAAEYCDDGSWSQIGSTCERTLTQEVDSCPSGHVLRNGSCHEVVIKSESCPSGYYNGNDGTCYNDQSQAAAENCPSGTEWTKSGTSCNYYDQQNVSSCPSGYTMKSGRCHEITPKESVCPSGYYEYGSQCRQTSRTYSADRSCPSGYYYNSSSGMCEDTDWRSADRSCPSGYSPSSIYSDQCAKVHPDYTTTGSAADVVCPFPYTKTPGDRCAHYVDYQYTCDSFYTLSGTSCFRTYQQYPSYSCDAGDTRSGTTCYEYRYTSQVNPCPSGTASLNTSYCYYTSASTNVGSCPTNYNLNTNGYCERSYSQTVSYSCPDSSWSLSGSTCSRTLTDPVNYYCNSGYSSLNTSQCYANTETNSVGNCVTGYTLNDTTGVCERYESKTVNYSCPDSSWSLSGSTCSRTLTDPVNYYCESGYSSLNSSECSKDTATNSAGNCSSPYSLNTSNGNCEFSDAKEVTYTCPAGSEWTLNKPNCDYYHEENVIVACPDQYQPNTDNTACSRTYIEEVSYKCPDSYFPRPSEDRCYRETTVPHL